MAHRRTEDVDDLFNTSVNPNGGGKRPGSKTKKAPGISESGGEPEAGYRLGSPPKAQPARVFRKHNTPNSRHREHMGGPTAATMGDDFLEVVFGRMAKDPVPRELEQTGRQMIRSGDPRLHQVGRTMIEAGRMLRAGNHAGAEEHFNDAWKMLEKVPERQRSGMLSRAGLRKDISGAGGPTTGEDVSTPTSGGSRKKKADRKTYGVGTDQGSRQGYSEA